MSTASIGRVVNAVSNLSPVDGSHDSIAFQSCAVLPPPEAGLTMNRTGSPAIPYRLPPIAFGLMMPAGAVLSLPDRHTCIQPPRCSATQRARPRPVQGLWLLVPPISTAALLAPAHAPL